MKTLLIFFIAIAATNSFAQVTLIWIGNTPGHEQDWNCSTNWSKNRLPDEFTDVVIPVDNTITNNYPVFKSGDVEINSLCIWSGASLTMKRGDLFIVNPDMSNYKPTQIVGAVKLACKGDTLYSSRYLASIQRANSMLKDQP